MYLGPCRKLASVLSGKEADASWGTCLCLQVCAGLSRTDGSQLADVQEILLQFAQLAEVGADKELFLIINTGTETAGTQDRDLHVLLKHGKGTIDHDCAFPGASPIACGSQ